MSLWAATSAQPDKCGTELAIFKSSQCYYEPRVLILKRHRQTRDTKPKPQKLRQRSPSRVEPDFRWKHSSRVCGVFLETPLRCTYPNLGELAQVYFTLSSLSVPIESMFSATGSVKNSRRLSISPHRLNRLCFGHDNYDKYKFLPIKDAVKICGCRATVNFDHCRCGSQMRLCWAFTVLPFLVIRLSRLCDVCVPDIRVGGRPVVNTANVITLGWDKKVCTLS